MKLHASGEASLLKQWWGRLISKPQFQIFIAMPRTYKSKRELVEKDREVLTVAVVDVQSHGCTVAQAARQYRVSYGTLQDHVQRVQQTHWC